MAYRGCSAGRRFGLARVLRVTPGVRMQTFARTTVFAACLALGASSAQAVTLIGLNSQNQLSRIDTANIAGATHVDITGLAAGDRFVGFDTRPSDGRIYGVTLSNQIYMLDEMTGAATFVAALSTPVVQAHLGYGIDFNPVADAGTGPSLRLISSAGGNYAVNVTTGLVGNVANTIAAGYTAVAYSNSVPFQAGAPASTGLYYIDSVNNTLAFAATAFNTPTISVIGALGVDVLSANGFEMLGNGQAFAALNVDALPSLATGPGSMNLDTR